MTTQSKVAGFDRLFEDLNQIGITHSSLSNLVIEDGRIVGYKLTYEEFIKLVNFLIYINLFQPNTEIGRKLACLREKVIIREENYLGKEVVVVRDDGLKYSNYFKGNGLAFDFRAICSDLDILFWLNGEAVIFFSNINILSSDFSRIIPCEYSNEWNDAKLWYLGWDYLIYFV